MSYTTQLQFRMHSSSHMLQCIWGPSFSRLFRMVATRKYVLSVKRFLITSFQSKIFGWNVAKFAECACLITCKVNSSTFFVKFLLGEACLAETGSNQGLRDNTAWKSLTALIPWGSIGLGTTWTSRDIWIRNTSKPPKQNKFIQHQKPPDCYSRQWAHHPSRQFPEEEQIPSMHLNGDGMKHALQVHSIDIWCPPDLHPLAGDQPGWKKTYGHGYQTADTKQLQHLRHPHQIGNGCRWSSALWFAQSSSTDAYATWLIW